MRVILLDATLLQLLDHLLLHQVDITLLLLQTLASSLNVLLHEDKLINIEIAVLSFSLQFLLFLHSALFPLLILNLPVFLVIRAVYIARIFLGSAFFRKHLVNQGRDVSRGGLLLDHGPLLHNCVLQRDTPLIPPQCLVVYLHVRAHIVVEDIVEGDRDFGLVQLTLYFSLGLSQISTLEKQFSKFLVRKVVA